MQGDHSRKFFEILEQIRYGYLKVIDPSGKIFSFGNQNSELQAEMTVYDWEMVEHIVQRGEIGFGESYIFGLWDTDNLNDLLTIFLYNLDYIDSYIRIPFWQNVLFRVHNFFKRNTKKNSLKNINAHYDIGNDFYELWLDQSMTYSSALYGGSQLTLEEAQKKKYERIIGRLPRGAKNILEIGCGFGGFVEEATKFKDIEVTALTISENQFLYAENRFKDLGISDRVNLKFEDYRDTKGKYDAIVSIEMFEAVGKKYWPFYFKSIKNLLNQGGRAVIQTITIDDKVFENYCKNTDFLRHYIFPGGFLASLPGIKKEVEKVGLVVSEVFSFGSDYAKTLKVWFERLVDKESEIINLGYSQSLIKLWKFYFAYCVAGFTVCRTNVVQIVLEHA